MYTQEVLEDLGTGFQCSVLSAKIKGLSLLKPTVSGRNCPNTAKHFLRDLVEYTDNQYAREASQIEKTSMNKSKSFTKTFSQLFLFLLFFHLLFSSYVHAPCAHYRERKRQVCIILNEFELLMLFIWLLLLCSNRIFLCLIFVIFSPFFCFSLHRFMHLVLIIRRGIDKYAFLSL